MNHSIHFFFSPLFFFSFHFSVLAQINDSLSYLLLLIYLENGKQKKKKLAQELRQQESASQDGCWNQAGVLVLLLNNRVTQDRSLSSRGPVSAAKHGDTLGWPHNLLGTVSNENVVPFVQQYKEFQESTNRVSTQRQDLSKQTQIICLEALTDILHGASVRNTGAIICKMLNTVSGT